MRALINIGERFGKWIVIDHGPTNYSRSKRPGRLLCRCDCGVEKIVWRSHLLDGDSKSCGCQMPKREAHYLWKGCGDLNGQHWREIVRNATGKRNRVAFEITITIEDAWNLFLSQDRKCALTGLPLTLGKVRTASLDRIDSSFGYIHGNVQWVHKDVNKMKNTFSQDHFVSICRLVTENR